MPEKISNKILPIEEGVKRPLWSVMIPTFNPGKYIYEAIRSVLNQDPGPEKMQIEVVDDCSTKVNVEKIVKENWGERVQYFRLPENVGHSFNFTESVRRAKGELIHLLHDDDRVKQGFYRTLGNIFKNNETIGAAFCRQAYIDESGKTLFYSETERDSPGILEDALIKLAQKQRIQYCAMVVRRKVFEQLGGFITKNIGCEDWEMWVRIAKDFPVYYEPEVLAEYRVHHGTSMTLKDMRSGQDMRFMREAINIFNEYVPMEKRKEVNLFRRKYYGNYSFRNAQRLFNEFNDNEGAAAQVSETIKIDSEIVFANKDFLTKLENPVEAAGVSVIINTQDDEELIERTLRHLIIQDVPKYIPWEIIIVDNGSTDDTLKTAVKVWEKYDGKISFKIIQLERTGLFEARSKGIKEASYNFILFCNPGNLLYRNYVKMTSINMMRDRALGAVGAYTDAYMKVDPPQWYEDWSKYCYRIGEQFENTNFVTWSAGYVWGAGMAIRKEAWQDIINKKFNSIFRDNQDKLTVFGMDEEICYAMRLSGWSIWYSMDLKLKQVILPADLEWKKLRQIFRHHGINSVVLQPYQKLKSHEADDYSQFTKRIYSRKQIRNTYRKLKTFQLWKLRLFGESLTGNSDILLIEYHIAILKEQLKAISGYNKRLRILKRISRKKDFEYLKHVIEKPYFRFPQYKQSKDRRGISVIAEFGNSGSDNLFTMLDNISRQKLPVDFPWEIILTANFIRDDIKKKLYMFWEKSNCSASLRIAEKNSANRDSLRISAIKKSKFDNIIFIDENDLPDSDYLRIAYKLLNKNKDAGMIGGQTELKTNVKPPKWFGNYKELFGIGKPAAHSGEINIIKEKLWNSGLIIRKSVLKEINYESSNGAINGDSGFDLPYNAELAGKVKLSGRKIIYNERLKLKKFIPVKNFSWQYLRKLNYCKGVSEVREFAIKEGGDWNSNGNDRSSSISWLYKANKTLGEIKKYPLKKIFSKEKDFSGDTEVLEIEKLQGRFKELIKNRNRYYKISDGDLVKDGFEKKSNGADSYKKTETGKKGVSIIICCYNSSEILPSTLKYLIRQEVPDELPWEVIIVDNASTDDTAAVAEKYWKDHNCLAEFRVVKEHKPGLSAARMKGFETAKYEYMVLCDDDNRLSKDFVKNVFEIMNENAETGILGGQSLPEFEKFPPSWFNDWKSSFAIGRQWEETGDITEEKGYVWGAAMVVRKEALNILLSKGFKSLLTDRKGNALSSGGDTELCYALRNEGWKIRYDERLKFKHYITSERLEWNYIKKLFRGFGRASTGLESYLKDYGKDIQHKSKKVSFKKELHKVLSTLRIRRYQKLTFEKKFEGDPDIPMIEYTLGRLESILKKRGRYNRKIKQIKRTARKRDLKRLIPYFRNGNNRFPGFDTGKKLNGVSIIICTFNGEDRLPETIKYVAKQKVSPEIKWEVILVDNASTDNTKQAVIDEWKKHNCKARLIIVDEFTQGLSAARQKGFDTSNCEYLVLCDDDNLLDERFVQTAYEIMSKHENVGVLGGPNEAVCEIEPPEWFKWFQHGYAAGTQADLQSGKVSEGNITWKRGFVWGAGMIIRKKAMLDLYSKGFQSVMSDRKGYHLTSGGDSELCFALVLSGWDVWYDTRLKLKHCMTAGRLEWNYLIRLFQGFGITSVGLDLYEKAIKLGRADINQKEILKQNWKYEYRKTYKELEKYGLKKILSLRFPQDNNTAIPMLEYYIARLNELKRVKNEYDRNLELIKNSKWIKSFKETKARHRKFIETENDFRYGWPWTALHKVKHEGKTYPKISILSPSFNSVNTIEKAILSVLNQNYPNLEHIICDGGSTDGTVEILKKYPHLKWVSEKDSGQCEAMNKAFEMSTGEIISYLNVDDYYQPEAFTKIAKAFEENPNAEMVVGNLFFEDENYTFIRKPEAEYKKIMLPFKHIFPINPVSYFYKKQVQHRTGPFPSENHYTMDYWFLLKAYQYNNPVKIEDYLGTFCMNGFNKTSGADNRKNTHYRVIEHCWKNDKKNLPFYLYNYYKFYYYDKQPYSFRKLYNKSRKNIERIYSVITLRKNKYYGEKLFQSARTHYYLNSRIRSLIRLAVSYFLYPKGITQRSRQSLFVYSLLGVKRSEEAKKVYFFLTTPPGLPLANKLYYFGNEFKKDNKAVKGRMLLFLTYLISPKFIFKKNQNKPETASDSKKLISKINPVRWLKEVYRTLRYRKYKETSYNLYQAAGSRYYHHKNFQATLLMFLSFAMHPTTLRKKSRLNLLLYSMFGNTISGKIKFIYCMKRDNPEYPFLGKLNFYGNQLRKENNLLKGNAILFLVYAASPKYIFRRDKIEKSKIVYASEFSGPKRKISINPKNLLPKAAGVVSNYKNIHQGIGERIRNTSLIAGYRIKLIYHYFRYRKFKARSKTLYSLAQESYIENKRLKTVMLMAKSYMLYPVSITNRNKLSLVINSVLKNNRK